MHAVVEVPWPGADRPPWPVADLAPGSWLVLGGGCSGAQAGTFVWALAGACGDGTPEEVIAGLVAEEALIVAGGLRVADSRTGAVVTPGCCAGLEDWRDWATVLDGGSPWLGHSPDPAVEVAGDVIRVWQDGGAGRRRSARVDIPRADLPVLLDGVQRDLAAFLEVLAGWSGAPALVRAVDDALRISGP
ncbi:hypothetical protein [Actinoplanes sp. NPDC023714]|uniref:hypothetical protein n=1 Tax=Actinoplanes sp. NPDC023714 TaxID=3154322 RepID=UPI0034025300